MSVNDYVDKPIGGTIAKIAFGLMFLVIGILPDPELDAGAHAVGVILGLALIAWGVVPYVIGWREAKEDEKERAEAEARRLAEEERIAHAPHKCPNCGATAHGAECEYCGAPLER
ncbi:MAG: hypothetical protein E7Z99_07975 [Coriobacteriaceae bacterium]|nr:hypothetical protein [Coriobacteriaceae bacterium]